MKKLFFLAIAMAVVALSSCNKDDDKNKNNDAAQHDAQFEGIAKVFLQNTVYPTYSALASATEQLVDELKTLRTNKTQANLDKACATFLEARAEWERSEAFLFGPAGDFGIDPHIDSWPLDEDAFNTGIKNTDLLNALNAEDGDVQAADNLGNTLLGFHCVEFVLFANGAPKQVADISDLHLIYATAVAGDLRNHCYQLEVSWMGADAPATHVAKVEALEMNCTVAGGGKSYAENMLSAGKAGSTFPSWLSVMQQIIQGCVDIADEVGASKIGKPNTGEDPTYIESPYSWNSIIDFYNNIVSIDNVYHGGVAGKRDAANSLAKFMEANHPNSHKAIEAAIDGALKAIGTGKGSTTGMKYPFVNNITDPSAAAASAACANLVEVLEAANNALVSK